MSDRTPETTPAARPISQRPAVKARKRFVILGHERSASTLIARSLDEHPYLRCGFEPFNRSPEHRARASLWGNVMWRENEDPVAFAEAYLFSAPQGSEVPIQGFKLFYQHCRETPLQRTLWSYLEADKDLHAVLLSRRNLAAAYISRERALRANAWNLPAASLTPEGYNQPFEVDIAACLDYVASKIAQIDALSSAFDDHPMLRLTFEEATRDYDEVVRRLWAFLDVPPIVLDPPVRRMSHKPLAEVLLNYEEVKQALAQSALAERAWLP